MHVVLYMISVIIIIIIKNKEHGEHAPRWGIPGFKKEANFFHIWGWEGLWKGDLKSWGQHGKARQVTKY